MTLRQAKSAVRTRPAVDETPGSPISLPSSITEIVYQSLRKDISRGVYRPGLIRLRALAARFGVSALPVREALRRLEAEGLVSFGPSRRIVINRLSYGELEEIFSIRSALETLALKRAVERLGRSTKDVARLKRLIQLMDEQETRHEDWQTTNQEFHKLIYSFAKLPRLESIIGSLWVSSEPYLRLYVKAVVSKREAQEQHRRLLKQIVAGDAEGAAATLREHLAVTLQVLQQRIGEEHGPGEDPLE